VAEEANRSQGLRTSGLDPKRIGNPERLPGGRDEGGVAARGSGAGGGGARPRYSPAERRELLAALEASGRTVREFAEAHDLKATTLNSWRTKGRGAALTRSQRGAGRRVKRKRYTADQRRAAVEAFLRSGRTQTDFAALWGVSIGTLSKWGGATTRTVRRGWRRARWLLGSHGGDLDCQGSPGRSHPQFGQAEPPPGSPSSSLSSAKRSQSSSAKRSHLSSAKRSRLFSLGRRALGAGQAPARAQDPRSTAITRPS